MKKEKTTEVYKLSILNALEESTVLRRAQLTLGPIRHVKNTDRSKLLNELISEGKISLEIRQAAAGKPAEVYRITEKGRRFAQNARQAA